PPAPRAKRHHRRRSNKGSIFREKLFATAVVLRYRGRTGGLGPTVADGAGHGGPTQRNHLGASPAAWPRARCYGAIASRLGRLLARKNRRGLGSRKRAIRSGASRR